MSRKRVIASGVLAALTTSTTAAQNVVKDAVQTDDFLTKSDALTIKAIRQETREVDFVASTDRLDSHYEIIDQASWQLSDYLDNPVVLYGHQSYDLPIGQATYVAVENGQLVCTIKFATAKANPMAEQVFQLVVEKVLRAVSVGFKPVDGNYEMRDGDEVWVWSRSILKEISVVPIGANPDALARAKSAIIARKKNGVADKPASNVAAEPAGRQDTNPKTTGGPPAGEKGTDMDIQKMLDEQKAKNESLSKTIADLNLKQAETDRELGSKTAKLEVTEKALNAAETQVKQLTDEAKVRETEHVKACTDRDSASKKASELEDKLVEVEVEAQVGVKITPGEKADFVALRKSNENLYKSMLDKRPTLALTERVTATDQKAAGAEGVKANGQPSPTTPAVTAKDAIDAFNTL